MNVLALDIGDSRVGVAYGDTSTLVSCPVKVVLLSEVLNRSLTFKSIIDDYMPDMFIIGLPKTLHDEENMQVKHIKEIASKISDIYNIKYEFVDERLSSKEAKSILREQGLKEKDMKGKVDSVAASLFLETWLKMQKK